MARALVRFERSNTDLPWAPAAVFLATADRLEGRALPGSEERDQRLEQALAQADHLLASDDPDAPDTYEAWIGWALDRFETGYFSWATEVVPTDTVDALFEREVAGWVDSTPPVPLSEPSFPVEPVGTSGGLELLELTEGVIFSVERETERRIYGVVSATDGDPVGFAAVQTSFRKIGSSVVRPCRWPPVHSAARTARFSVSPAITAGASGHLPSLLAPPRPGCWSSIPCPRSPGPRRPRATATCACFATGSLAR
jgi:hypothetical protein